MDDTASPQRSSFFTQANALLRKNLTIQKRRSRGNLCEICSPILICLILFLIQRIVDTELGKPRNKCGCKCVDMNGDGVCENICGVQFSTMDQVFMCPIPNPPEWPPLLQVPLPEYRAAKNDFESYVDLDDESCRKYGTCPATLLITGSDKSFANVVARHLFTGVYTTNASEIPGNLSNFVLGSDSDTARPNYMDPAFFAEVPLYIIQKNCTPDFTSLVQFQNFGDIPIPPRDVKCVSGTFLWRESSSAVNDELYKGYRQASPSRTINEIMAAYDFLKSDKSNFDVRVWFNSTKRDGFFFDEQHSQLRIVRSVNMVSNAYLKFIKGADNPIRLDYIKEMPKPATELKLDISSLMGPFLLKFIIELIFPVMLTYLVYEKQHKLRIMMKMHGLGDGPYWIISYGYFLSLSLVYVFFLVIVGSLIGLPFFYLNDYSIQVVFFFVFANLQIVITFLAAAFFSEVNRAQAIAYFYIVGTTLLAGFLFNHLLEDISFSRNWIQLMEVIPAFALYRGLYEFGQYSFNGHFLGTSGMLWENLHDNGNGMGEVLVIMIVEWLILLPITYYTDHFSSVSRQIRKKLLVSLSFFRQELPISFRRHSFQRQVSHAVVEIEKPDVKQERELVKQMLHSLDSSNGIICDNIRKVYPGNDGNPEKLAVQGLSVALPRGECFGVLGPNGAGKTTFINMMTGLISVSSGEAYVEGQSIKSDMDKIYNSMGVCPQHDMLWDVLTGREHLLFYGRLKNLTGAALTQAVEESLRSANLFYGGVADKQARQYSGGMKRRLSVAISLIGDPKVVYMDEPSTGLDPASRKKLWNVVKNAKENRAILLTTHSMEEAEVICDRLGIFVNGSLQCIGNPKELKARYGGTYVLTVTTSPSNELEVENLVHQLSSNARKIYRIEGTQKFEIPKHDIKIAGVFKAVEEAKRRVPIYAWGLSDTTLEDVFIKVASEAGQINPLS